MSNPTCSKCGEAYGTGFHVCSVTVVSANTARALEHAVVEAAIGWMECGLVPPLEDAVADLQAHREARNG